MFLHLQNDAPKGVISGQIHSRPNEVQAKQTQTIAA